MSRFTITIDAGTTNTRTMLWNSDRQLVAAEGELVGVRDTAIEKNNDRLKNAVKTMVDRLLHRQDITYEQIDRIIASGMITSNLGLVEIPHVTAPAGAHELAEGARSILLPEICPIPILFIPGVKNAIETVTMENFSRMDIMRGEEVESLAIYARLQLNKSMVIILPGSHTKLIKLDMQGRILGSMTTISGELLSCITNNTIIADAVQKSFATAGNYNQEMLLKGYDTAKATGIGNACFLSRILSQFAVASSSDIASYILGSVLENDIAALRKSKMFTDTFPSVIAVSGKKPLRRALCEILKHEGGFGEIIEVEADQDAPFSALGAFVVADTIETL